MKTYIVPAIDIVEAETQQMLAASALDISSTETGTQLAPELPELPIDIDTDITFE